MISCEFETVEQAVEYGQKQGGWLFYRNSDGHTFWHDARKFTLTEVIIAHDGEGYVGTWTTVKDYAELYTAGKFEEAK